MNSWFWVIPTGFLFVYFLIRKISRTPSASSWVNRNFSGWVNGAIVAVGLVASGYTLYLAYIDWRGPSRGEWARHENSVCVVEVDPLAARMRTLAKWYPRLYSGQSNSRQDYERLADLFRSTAKAQRRVLVLIQEVDAPRGDRTAITQALYVLGSSTDDFQWMAGVLAKLYPSPPGNPTSAYTEASARDIIGAWLYGVKKWNRVMWQMGASYCTLPDLARVAGLSKTEVR